jgi:hypothetical protein
MVETIESRGKEIDGSNLTNAFSMFLIKCFQTKHFSMKYFLRALIHKTVSKNNFQRKIIDLTMNLTLNRLKQCGHVHTVILLGDVSGSIN